MERPSATLLKWPLYHTAPGWRDGLALAMVILIILLLGVGARQMVSLHRDRAAGNFPVAVVLPITP